MYAEFLYRCWIVYKLTSIPWNLNQRGTLNLRWGSDIPLTHNFWLYCFYFYPTFFCYKHATLFFASSHHIVYSSSTKLQKLYLSCYIIIIGFNLISFNKKAIILRASSLYGIHLKPNLSYGYVWRKSLKNGRHSTIYEFAENILDMHQSVIGQYKSKSVFFKIDVITYFDYQYLNGQHFTIVDLSTSPFC